MRKWIHGYVWMAAILGAVVVACLWLTPRERLLLEHATPIISTSHRDNFEWISNQEVRFSRFVPDPDPNSDRGDDEFFIYDVARKRERREPIYTKRLKQVHGGDGWGLSPDGRWGYSNSRDGTTSLTDFATGRKMEVPSDEANWHGIEWFKDSRRWLNIVSHREADHTFSTYSHLFVHDLDAPGKVIAIENTSANPFYFRNEKTEMTCIGDWIYTIHYKDEPDAPPLKEVELRSHNLHDPANLHRVTRVRLSEPAHIQWVDFSQKASKIAWALGVQRPTIYSWLHRFVPAIHPQNTFLLVLWISDRDGSNMREIGHISSGINDLTLEHVSWLPDDKRVSFVYNDTLYTVPVE